ncbi:hypothetical protein D9757_009092 [Collybiopsis confluens]|uniref:Plus3 domain-containing protein n=1 Tax=Collybiopsis confluens TaxID=2823264 RepID=A0A8H5H949_9AGAR|nr:hypothetical protein D9757_009092 [Collybiopsis confluens]
MQRLLQMPEIEREDIIATRLEERQKVLDRKAIALLLKKQQEGDSDGATGVARAAKRQHTARGATKEKSNKLDELKAKRKARDEKSKTRTHSPKRDRSSSPMDMETSSSDEDEDGVITKDEQEEERERRLINGGRNSTHVDEIPGTMQDLERCRASRQAIVKHMYAPWFPQYMKGAYVRYLIGNNDDNGQPVYRICQVVQLSEETIKPYKVEEKMYDHQAELLLGKSIRRMNLDRVSNTPFSEREFNRLKATCVEDKVPPPSKPSLENKAAEMKRLIDTPLTESDINAMLNRSRELAGGGNTPRSSVKGAKMERSRLVQARTLAHRRGDHREVEELGAQIVEFDAKYGTSDPGSTSVNGGTGVAGSGTGGGGGGNKGDVSSSGGSVLMKLSEKNRKANAEAVRRAEQQEAERKRKERKMALMGGGDGSGRSTPVDPSARLKTVPRTMLAKTPTPGPSRPGTPSQTLPKADGASTPTPSTLSSSSPLAGMANNQSFEAKVLAAVDVDLGDF